MSYTYTPKELIKSYEALYEKEASATYETETADTPIPAPAPGSFTAAAIQISASGLPNHDVEGFWILAQQAVEKAASEGANLILLPELFLGPYFCQSRDAGLQAVAQPISEDHFMIRRMKQLAAKHKVVLPISLYERANNVLYNSIVMIDADGTVLGKYRKSHIPDDDGYQEKFYFTPGDTGFKVFHTRFGVVGIAICWDQWFPEAARAMALLGADVLLYPTAIGDEPQDQSIDSAGHWQRVMQGHAAANMIPVVASNRAGTEILLRDDGSERQRMTFHGRSFITDETGAIQTEATKEQKEPFTVLTSVIYPAKNRAKRLMWGLFRDRRPDLYGILLTKDGSS